MRALDAYIKLMRAANSVGSRLEQRLGLTESQFRVSVRLTPAGKRKLGRRESRAECRPA